MGVIGDTRLEKIVFYEAHITPWTTNAAAVGLLPASVTALGTLTANARKAYNEHIAAQTAAKSATRAFYDKVRLMHNGPGAGSDMIDTIRTFAATTNNPNVFVLAQVPPPATPSTLPPPGTPADFTVALLQDGALKLGWKCNNPTGTTGTMYEVLRRAGSSMSGPFNFIGQVGVKSIIDSTLPAGASPCTYRVTAVRSTQRGAPAQFTVTFGVGGGGGLAIASVTEMAPVRLAA